MLFIRFEPLKDDVSVSCWYTDCILVNNNPGLPSVYVAGTTFWSPILIVDFVQLKDPEKAPAKLIMFLWKESVVRGNRCSPFVHRLSQISYIL